MQREPGVPEQGFPPPEQVELALAHLENSAAFRSSARHRALLRHLVSRVLSDQAATLKETLIAIEVFGRPAARFDPKNDTIVRVEARRLRARLSTYYGAEGRHMPVQIELPVGSYVPRIVGRAPSALPNSLSRQARDLMERGEHFLRLALTQASLEQAAARFEEVLLAAPDHAPAWVGLGRAWLNLATGWYHPPAVASARASQALRRALEIEPENAVAQVLLGALRHQFERDWAGANHCFQRALACAGEAAFVHSAYGCHLLLHGAFDVAERHLVRARLLDPHYVNTRQHMVNLRIAQGRLDDAEAEVLALHDVAPEAMAVAGLRGAIAMARGDASTAISHFRRACELMPSYPGCSVALAGALALDGRVDEADALMAAALRALDGRPLSPYLRALYATRRGRKREALAWLASAIDERDPLAMQIPHEPGFVGLHDQAGWEPLLSALRRPQG